MISRLADRTDAGRRLADAIVALPAGRDAIVLALPRGGVPVAAVIADVMKAPLDVLVVRKLGLPGQRELAMGAIATGGVRVLNDEVIDACGVTPGEIEATAAREAAELARREQAYRGDRPNPLLRDRQVILVDDGIATGSTMFAAIEAVRRQRPSSIIVAVPIAPRDTLARLRNVVDQVVCLAMPEPFIAIGLWYDHFPQVADDDVRTLLERHRAPDAPGPAHEPGAAKPQEK